MSAVAKHEPVANTPAIAQTEPNPIMAMIAQAVQSGQPIEVIRELKDMAKELAADEARRAFDEAVSAAKAEITPIAKTRKGHNSNYADLGSIAKAIDPIISKHGLSYRHHSTQGDKISVTCVLSHKSGHFEETTLSASPDTSGSKNSIQAIGSTLTYLQRYTLVLALGLAMSNDDDGAAAGTGETISDEQLATIRALADEVGADLEKFCQYFRIEALPDLPASQFTRAKQSLEAKRARS